MDEEDGVEPPTLSRPRGGWATTPSIISRPGREERAPFPLSHLGEEEMLSFSLESTAATPSMVFDGSNSSLSCPRGEGGLTQCDPCVSKGLPSATPRGAGGCNKRSCNEIPDSLPSSGRV